MRWWLIVLPGLVMALAVHGVWAQPSGFEPSPYIYRLNISGCGEHQPARRRQSGFRVQGMAGIVTALHGVADCSDFAALSDGDNPPFRDLRIQAVDIDNDVALLTSAELLALPAEGLSVTDLPGLQTEKLRVIGYPLGLDQQDVITDVSISYTRTLASLIPDADLTDAFVERNSPNLAQQVFRVQAHLVPGHSGAPLLDSAGRVVAIANGGLKGGAVEMGWAMPWRAIHWQPLLPAEDADAAVLARFNVLKTQNPQLALSFSSTYPAEVSVNAERQTIVGLVTGINDEPVIGAEVTLSLADSYFIDITATGGKYRFSVPTDYRQKQPEILVEATGYEPYRIDIFELPPAAIPLTVVDLPRPVDLEPGQYLRIMHPNGVALQVDPKLNSRRVMQLSRDHTVQVIGGPVQDEERTWWQVEEIATGQRGWIVPADAANVFVEPLPLFYVGDVVRVIAAQRRPFYDAPGVGQQQPKAVEPASVLNVLAGPQVASGYLWYKLERADGVQGWLAGFGYGRAYLALTSDVLPISTTMTASQPAATATPIPDNQIHIFTTGVGFAPQNETNTARKKQGALLAAKTDANRNFALWKDGAELEAVTIVDQGELKTDIIRAVVRTRVFGGTVIEQNYDEATGMAQVTVEYVVNLAQ